jgi:PHD/YefM family antitoxin component YafN of YafNO toxin-antitoxin module
MGFFKRIKSLLSDRYVLITKEEWDNLRLLTKEEWTNFQYNLRREFMKPPMITKEEWQQWKDTVAGISARIAELSGLPTAVEFESLRSLAEQANILCEGLLPDSGITARKVGNLTVTTGIPNQG